jgi:hypothetical protein
MENCIQNFNNFGIVKQVESIFEIDGVNMVFKCTPY